jgi:hypothetical protein
MRQRTLVDPLAITNSGGCVDGSVGNGERNFPVIPDLLMDIDMA